MKPTNRKLAVALTALTLIATVQTSLAMYDPGLQRWINRDPLDEPGFEIVRNRLHVGSSPYRPAEKIEGPNLYDFVHNSPLAFIDPYGDRLAPACAACATCLTALAVDCAILCRDGTWDEKDEGFLSCMAKCATASPLYNTVCGGICAICGINSPKPCPPPRPSLPPPPPRVPPPHPPEPPPYQYPPPIT